MISEKDYLRLMRQHSCIECPKEITKMIVTKSGILEKSAPADGSRTFSEKSYGFACALVTMLILGLSLLSPIQPNNNVRIALNTKVLVSQLTHGTIVMLTDQNR